MNNTKGCERTSTCPNSVCVSRVVTGGSAPAAYGQLWLPDGWMAWSVMCQSTLFVLYNPLLQLFSLLEGTVQTAFGVDVQRKLQDLNLKSAAWSHQVVHK